MARIEQIFWIAGLLAVALAAGPRCQAQAPAGPLPQTESKDKPAATREPAEVTSSERTKNLAGAWSLNLDESDDGRKAIEQARGSSGGGVSHRPRISGGMGGPGGYGGVGMGGHGGGGHRSEATDEEREEMAEILRPPNSLTFTQNEPEIRVMDDQGRSRTYYTDGRKVDKSKDANNQSASATWVDYKLTAEEKGPKGNKIERSYEVAPGGQQLWETVHFTVGKSKAPVTIRYVYDKGLGPRQARQGGERER